MSQKKPKQLYYKVLIGIDIHHEIILFYVNCYNNNKIKFKGNINYILKLCIVVM